MVKGPSNFKNENLVLLHQIGPNLLSIGLESHKVFLHIMKLGYTSQKMPSRILLQAITHIHTHMHTLLYTYTCINAHSTCRNMHTQDDTDTQIQDEQSEDWAVLINLCMAVRDRTLFHHCILYFIINNYFLVCQKMKLL